MLHDCNNHSTQRALSRLRSCQMIGLSWCCGRLLIMPELPLKTDLRELAAESCRYNADYVSINTKRQPIAASYSALILGLH